MASKDSPFKLKFTLSLLMSEYTCTYLPFMLIASLLAYQWHGRLSRLWSVKWRQTDI